MGPGGGLCLRLAHLGRRPYFLRLAGPVYSKETVENKSTDETYSRIGRRCIFIKSGDGDIAARIPGTFSVRVSNVARRPASGYSWTRTVSVTLNDIGVRVDLLQRRRVRVNRRVFSYA